MAARKQPWCRCALLAALLCQPLACGEEPIQLGSTFVSLGRVGPDGGTLCAGTLCLTFPRGAVKAEVEVKARLVPAGAPDKAVVLMGDIYELSATVSPFLKPINLTLPLPDGILASEAQIFWRGEAQGQWKAAHRTANQTAGGVTVSTPHLSQWAVGKPAK